MRFDTALTVMLDVDVIFRLVGQLKKKLLFILSHTEDDKILFLSFIEISVEEKKDLQHVKKYDSMFIKLCFINSNNAVNRCFSDYLG